MKKIIILIVSLLVLVSCSKNEEKKDEFIVVANKPLELIVQELVGDEIELYCITKPSDSPHTFNPKPSDIQRIENGKIFLYVSDEIDNWVKKGIRKDKIEVIDYIPLERKRYYGVVCCNDTNLDDDDDCGEGFTDPHFWLDPLIVKEVVPEISRDLVNAFPEQKEFINKNRDRFIAELEKLDKAIENEMKVLKGAALLSFHPSYEYYINRYGLLSAGAIEISPGKEITPQYLQELKKRIEKYGIENIFTEPQLPEKSANCLAEIAKVQVQILDPLGGADNTKTYRDLLLYNTLQLKKYLKKPINKK